MRYFLDNDLYKFTMQNAILHHFPSSFVRYQFTNRSPEMKFNQDAYADIIHGIVNMCDVRITDEELNFLNKRCPYLSEIYLEKLRKFRFDPSDVACYINRNDELILSISGAWFNTILWEVPLLSIISESYFKNVDNEWNYRDQEQQAREKANILNTMLGMWSDFGTRRRRSYISQDMAITGFVRGGEIGNIPSRFFGTSNVHFAKKHNITAVGTMAHEWIMGVCGINKSNPINANRVALELWLETYGIKLGIALTDTYGTDLFFSEFDETLSKIFNGVRHDSGDPLVFVDKVIAHYEKHNIDPKTKIIVFSDSLNVDKAITIDKYCWNKINCSFGIGTNFTNDFKNVNTGKVSKPLNIVIKLYSINNTTVAKLSDDFRKATGEQTAINNTLLMVNEIVRK